MKTVDGRLQYGYGLLFIVEMSSLDCLVRAK